MFQVQSFYDDVLLYRESNIPPAMEHASTKITSSRFKPGARIHLRTLRGLYTVVSSTNETIVITAKSWEGKERTVPIWHFKCFEGLPSFFSLRPKKKKR
jgi:hypothetical protein